MNSLTNIIGTIGVCLLVFSSIPQLYKTYMTKNVDGLSLSMVVCWFLGCLFTLIYVIAENKGITLILNYTSTGIISLLLIILYKKHSRK